MGNCSLGITKNDPFLWYDYIHRSWGYIHCIPRASPERNTGYLHHSRGTAFHNCLYLYSPTYTYTCALSLSQKFPRPPPTFILFQ